MAAATRKAFEQDRSAERLVRRLYDAFVRGDRATFEPMLADDFRFTSPYDNAIDKQQYFERCWPNHVLMESMRFVRVAEAPGGAFVTYEICFRDGRRANNTEWLSIRDGHVHSVEVYFGADHPSPDPESRDPYERRTPGPEATWIRTIVGTWSTHGHNLPSDPSKGPPQPVEGEETWTAMEGGFFVRGHWVRRFSTGDHVGVSIVGMEPERGSVMVESFDNLGYSREYRVSFEDEGRTWKLIGAHERATYTFSGDGSTFEVYWEMSRDGHDWKPLCRLEGRRTAAA